MDTQNKCQTEASAKHEGTGVDSQPPPELETFLQELVERHTNEPEFHDAVREFMESVFPEIEGREELSRDAVLERMVEPDRIFSFRVCWEDDEGRVQVNRGYRVQFNNTLGPYKGGLRFPGLV